MNKKGDVLTVGIKRERGTGHVRVRDAKGAVIYDAKDLKSDKELQNYVRFVWKKRT